MKYPEHRYPRKSPTYRSWDNMKSRVLRPRPGRHDNYQTEKITFCERWAKFENFLEDMGVRPEGTSLGRINDTGNYEPGNCEWQTQAQQTEAANNKRMANA